MEEERPHAQVGVDALHLRGVHRAVLLDRDEPVVDALALQAPRHRVALAMRVLHGIVADVAQVSGDLVRQHLLEAKAEQVRGVAAVRPRHHVAPRSGRAPRAAVAAGATVHEAGAKLELHVDVTLAVLEQRALTLVAEELPLEDLTSAADGASRIPGDDVSRGVRRRGLATTTNADLL